MFESTATWMEEKVYPDVDDYHQYVAPWSQLSTMPITLADSSKMYGSAMFDRWLDDIYGEDIVRRRVGALRRARTASRPAAYDTAIREAHGPGFSYELIDLAASTAEWKTADSGVHEGATFPEMKRIPVKLPTDGTVLSRQARPHRATRCSTSRSSDAPKLKLTGGAAGRHRGRDRARRPQRRQASGRSLSGVTPGAARPR